ncbi:carbon-nitrogen hydrolase family protein [Agrobacterium sp. rho-13.3]|uniref:carbon-nitrogen hydrolase family protein n=1 Tax=Agrobacterium sp. rho-13.3 TaxID=3072980 RepID=UPI002A159FAF|nr:carbon-nitrogen hydrolase family protein [Agrobacterium sp. rho-13.3]MDX8312000.1 carbon-nitrogen hydrolase family protein [Agrobacterium sp. rho-13.3]
MKIAAAQSIVTNDIAENGRTIRVLIEEAAKQGARLVNFCEGALSGYSKAQIASPEDWHQLDWKSHSAELEAIAQTCKKHGIFAVVGSAHPFNSPHPPHNSQYIVSDSGDLVARYDKRYLSNSELSGWFTPGKQPVTLEIDGYRFGCLTCIEVQFPELFMEYERLDVDAILFSSYGIRNFFQIALRAHAGFNCLWISGATPAQTAPEGPAGIIGPDGKIISHCPAEPRNALAFALIDRDNPAYDGALNKARPWRRAARDGDIYRDAQNEA